MELEIIQDQALELEVGAFSGMVDDVKQNGVSVVTDRIALVTVPTKTSDITNDGDGTNPFLTQHQSLSNYYTKTQTDSAISNHHDTSKQDTLVSGTNIKTINNQTILGSGNIQIDGGVQSVNGQTGVVVLDADDVGALPNTTVVPTKTSQLQNDSGFLTQHQSLANYDTKAEVNTKIANATNDMATQTWVEGKGYLTEHQSLSAYRTSSAQDIIDATKVDKETNTENIVKFKKNNSNGSSLNLDEGRAWLQTINIESGATNRGNAYISADLNPNSPYPTGMYSSGNIKIEGANLTLLTGRDGGINFNGTAFTQDNPPIDIESLEQVLEEYQPIENKVTSWSATTSNDNYPSEKLVKDSLDGKQNTITSSNKLDYSLLSNTPSIPSKTSDLTNDGDGTNAFITSSYHDSTKQNTLTTAQLNACNSGITSGKVSTYDGYNTTISNNTSAISTINGKIPSQATTENQLADKDFVNSSIATNTSTFRGTSASGLTEEQFLAWANSLTKTNNDYVFWNTTDENGNVVYKRYKYNGTSWIYEYSLNNSSFTSVQWGTINSGFTSTDKTNFDAIGTTYATKSELTSGLSTKQNTINAQNTIYAKYSICSPSSLYDGTNVEDVLETINSSKQNSLSTAQLNACNSGITSSKVSTYDGYASGKQNTITSSNKLSASLVSGLSTVATSGSYTDLSNKPTIPTVPTNISAFTNDSGYVTSSYHDATKYDASNPNGYTSNVGTITGITMNGASKGTSGVVNLGTVLTSHQDISGKENTSNKVTSISSSSTNTQYPSAKCVYDLVGNIETLLQALR